MIPLGTLRARYLAALGASLFLLGPAGASALAHQQTTTFGQVTYPDGEVNGADLSWKLRVRLFDLAALLAGGSASDGGSGVGSAEKGFAGVAGGAARRARTVAILRAGLRVSATVGDRIRPCTPGPATLVPDPSVPEPTLLFTEPFTCGPGARTLHLRYDLFFDHDALHEGFTRLTLGEGQAGDDPSASVVVFQDRRREIAVEVRDRAPESIWRSATLYLRLGIAHILTGSDHLAFLLALLLAAGLRERTAGDRTATAASARQAVRSTLGIVSAFTVAHSITLITQVLHPGWIATRWVEPAIAFSVAFVGFENLLPRRPRGRWLLVFGFGLVHGLGFASVLRQIGLPRRGLVLSLVSFNLGVELGQILIVGLALPIIVTAGRRAPRRFERWGLQLGSGIIAGLGTIWLVARVVAAR